MIWKAGDTGKLLLQIIMMLMDTLLSINLGNLVCDGYFKYPWEVKEIRENSTDNGPDPHKKDAEYICKVLPDWENGTLSWIPLCRHDSDWLGQDAHPHPAYSHTGRQDIL